MQSLHEKDDRWTYVTVSDLLINRGRGVTRGLTPGRTTEKEAARKGYCSGFKKEDKGMVTLISYMILIVTALIYAGSWVYFNQEQIFERVTDVLAIGCYHIGQIWALVPDNAVA
jgi:hypothetical protein